ncbi:MAG: nuclear transport factor 2 family protein [Planctomycetota bacterium]|nr:nuclear transport factor 2 family protein [Planctomycetota bacterium]
MTKLVAFGGVVGFLLGVSTGEVRAQQDSAGRAGEECIQRVQSYWAAFSKQDAATAVAMHSPKGIYATNSDGSFHKPLKISSVEQMKENLATYSGLWKVYYPEAISFSKDVMLTRYYLEGLSKSDGKTTPYRTRVTHIWVNENGKWLTRSWHFSPAAYGGVHVTQSSDFKKE